MVKKCDRSSTCVIFLVEESFLRKFRYRDAWEVAIAIENAMAYREISELKDKLAQEICISKKKFAAS